MANKIIAVDFDGTIVAHAYPEIGRDNPNAIRVLTKLIEQGTQLILWTMRSGKELQEAVDYCTQNGIVFWGINENPAQKEWTDSPKAYAPIYIDDAALGCPLEKKGFDRPMVYWPRVREQLIYLNLLA